MRAINLNINNNDLSVTHSIESGKVLIDPAEVKDKSIFVNKMT